MCFSGFLVLLCPAPHTLTDRRAAPAAQGEMQGQLAEGPGRAPAAVLTNRDHMTSVVITGPWIGGALERLQTAFTQRIV